MLSSLTRTTGQQLLPQISNLAREPEQHQILAAPQYLLRSCDLPFAHYQHCPCLIGDERVKSSELTWQFVLLAGRNGHDHKTRAHRQHGKVSFEFFDQTSHAGNPRIRSSGKKSLRQPTLRIARSGQAAQELSRTPLIALAQAAKGFANHIEGLRRIPAKGRFEFCSIQKGQLVL